MGAFPGLEGGADVAGREVVLPATVLTSHLDSCAAELAADAAPPDDLAQVVVQLVSGQRHIAAALNRLAGRLDGAATGDRMLDAAVDAAAGAAAGVAPADRAALAAVLRAASRASAHAADALAAGEHLFE